GRLAGAALEKMIRKGNGRVSLKTASGGTLVASMNGARNIIITDESGGTARISTYDVYQSNGVIQVIDKVLLPKM
ncbi:MAG TPA: fasciclin domain-containing protein, partial [Gemmatimonadaceae bacterium]|nr:fasciclin domain-containing protein [Gemmatimonadaceae bacterium]